MKNITSCRFCGSKDLVKVLKLESMSLVDDYIGSVTSEKYPTELFGCENCDLVQLGVVVEPEVMFNSNYAYRTGSSPGLVKHFNNLAADLVDRLELNSGSLVVDVGCNDGTLLKAIYKKNICRILGIDPAAPHEIPAIRKHFSKEISREIIFNYGRADLVIATNVLAHVDDLIEFLDSVKKLLRFEGLFVCEVGSLGAIVDDLVWETVYHEHLSYFSPETLTLVLNKVGFRVLCVEPINTHGGSIRAICMSGNSDMKFPASHDWEVFQAVKDNIEERRNKIIELIGGDEFVGFGASAKASVILSQTKLRPEIVVDDSFTKQNRFMPGTDIPIKGRNALNYFGGKLLVLAWNEAEAIVKSLPEFSGRFVIAAPQPYVA